MFENLTADFIKTLLASTVVAAVVSGVVSVFNGERNIQIENITQERQKWRDKIRGLSTEILNAALSGDEQKLKNLRHQMALNLNPSDHDDQAILELIPSLYGQDHLEEGLAEFFDRVSLLLKHDWERSKQEAGFWMFRLVSWAWNFATIPLRWLGRWLFHFHFWRKKIHPYDLETEVRESKQLFACLFRSIPVRKKYRKKTRP